MRKLMLGLFVFATGASFAFAGTEYSGGKVMDQRVATQQDCWYGENEWNVSVWGTYAFTGTSSNSVGFDEFFFGDDGGNRGDTYIQNDHAWGGGLDLKYFWRRYFGFGVQGFVLDSKRTEFDLEEPPPGGFAFFTKEDDERLIGSVLGTFTLRYPIGCSRFAPYVWAGGGAIFGGGERDQVVFDTTTGLFTTDHDDSTAEPVGQFGGGLEVRITRNIGWINDFSWNVVNGPRNNFGMFRTGINFAF